MEKELDLVDEDDQITHLLSLADEDFDSEDKLSKPHVSNQVVCL